MTAGPRFIAFEGVDGVGKSTQVARLTEALQRRGRTVITVREPGGTSLGEAVREILLNAREIELRAESEALLFLASRVQLFETVIRPALEAGSTVISDRFHLSTLIYQGIAGQLGDAHVRSLLRGVLGERRPDLNIIVRAPLDVCRERLSGSLDRFESRDGFLERVHEGFERLAAREILGLPGDRIESVDASRSIEAIAVDVESLVCGPAAEEKS